MVENRLRQPCSEGQRAAEFFPDGRNERGEFGLPHKTLIDDGTVIFRTESLKTRVTAEFPEIERRNYGENRSNWSSWKNVQWKDGPSVRLYSTEALRDVTPFSLSVELGRMAIAALAQYPAVVIVHLLHLLRWLYLMFLLYLIELVC